MHGNVCEWCLDWHGPYPGTETDPRDKGLPAAECTVYLEAYRGEHWKEGLYSYRFVGANAFADQTIPGNSKEGLSHMAVAVKT